MNNAVNYAFSKAWSKYSSNPLYWVGDAVIVIAVAAIAGQLI